MDKLTIVIQDAPYGSEKAYNAQQINFQIPWEGWGQSLSVLTVSNQGVAGASVSLSLAPFGPGIFSTDSSGSGQGAVLIANTPTMAAPLGAFPDARPARRGETVTIYSTGLGPVTNQPLSGAKAKSAPLSITTSMPTVTIGGSAAPIRFSGLAPDFVGQYQVNVQIPSDIETGSAVPITITAGGIASNTVTIAVD